MRNPINQMENGMNTLAIETRNVNKYFGGGFDYRRLLPGRSGNGKSPAHVLRDVSFSVQRGEIYGVLGANGSGKSTLVRIMSTLLLPDSGEARIFGLDVVRDSSEVRSLINRVSADPSFFRNMSAVENLLFFGRVYGLSPSEIKQRLPGILARPTAEDRRRAVVPHVARGDAARRADHGPRPAVEEGCPGVHSPGQDRARQHDPADDARHGGGGAAL